MQDAVASCSCEAGCPSQLHLRFKTYHRRPVLNEEKAAFLYRHSQSFCAPLQHAAALSPELPDAEAIDCIGYQSVTVLLPDREPLWCRAFRACTSHKELGQCCLQSCWAQWRMWTLSCASASPHPTPRTSLMMFSRSAQAASCHKTIDACNVVGMIKTCGHGSQSKPMFC